MKFLMLEEVDSTNSYVAVHASELEDMTMVMAETQTAGRGQRGNSWESEPGCNLTFTLFCSRPDVVPSRQFAISEATALGVVDMLESYGIVASVKWPNDVYVGDKKISGILIEHSLCGNAIEHSRIGIGLNVNQKEFLSDAPNPVSIKMITGEDSDLTRAAAVLYDALNRRLTMAYTEEGRQQLHDEFLNRLWRSDGELHPFRDRDSGDLFNATILDVEPEGMLILKAENEDAPRRYAFKEVEFIL